MYQIVCRFPKIPFALSLLLLFTSGKVHPQNLKAIDSLKLLAETRTGIDKYDVLFELGFEYYLQGHIEQALATFQDAKKISLKHGDSIRIVKATRIEFQMLRRLGREQETLQELISILPVAKRLGIKEEQEYILNSLAITYTLHANYDKALEYHFQNLVLREQDGDSRKIRECLNNIGIVYFKLRNYAKALEYYNLALEHDNDIKNSDFRDVLLINIGLCYNQLGRFDEARGIIMKAFDYCSPNCQDFTVLHGEFGLGVSYYGQKMLQQSKSHFQKSYQTAVSNNDMRFQAENSVYLAHIYVRSGQYDSALLSLAKTEEIALKDGFSELLIESYREYANLYSLQEDFQNASLYQNKYISLKDSIYSGELIDRIAKITTQFQERINLQTIADKEETIARQRELNISIAIIAVLLSALIFVLYHSIKVKRRVNADLSDAKAIIEDQNRQLLNSNVHLNQELKERNLDLQRANDSLHRVNEELDNFIYKTSHDIRGPLASLKGMCNVALMDVKDPLALNYLHKLDITAEKLNTILTRLLIVNQINNSSLLTDRIDFEAIVEDILTLERKKGIPKQLKITPEICASTVFYSDPQFVRIILENLIDNAIKFYNDSDRVQPFVRIAIAGNEEHVSINVVDNGIGISEVHPDKIFQMFSRASERSETGGIGLYITKTAAEKLGGSVHLKTTPEGYTEFYVKLPYNMSKVLSNGDSVEGQTQSA